MGQFLMPSLGADMEAGTLIEWLKKPGDKVSRGDIVAVVETQKGAIEIEVFEDGTLESQLVDLGTKVPVGTPLAIIDGGEERKAEPAPAKAAEPPPAPPEAKVEPKPAPAPTPTPPPPAPRVGKRVRITPAALRLAETSGVDPRSLPGPGSGPEGAFTLADIQAVAGEGRKAEEPSGMRTAIAAAMARSKREIPHYYLAHVIDLTAVNAYLSDLNTDSPPEDRILIGAAYLKAVAKALAKYTEFNGHYEDGIFRESGPIHPGMAVNIRGGGLVAPAIHDADQKCLAELMASMRDVAGRVRAGRFRARELSDATITVTSLGDRGVETVYGVITPPQVAVLGFGAITDRALVVDGTVAPRPAVTVTLAADHRVSDGHRGGLFLRAIDAQLQQPEKL